MRFYILVNKYTGDIQGHIGWKTKKDADDWRKENIYGYGPWVPRRVDAGKLMEFLARHDIAKEANV